MIDLHWSWSDLLFSFIFLSQTTYFRSLPFPFYFLLNIYHRSIIIDHFSYTLYTSYQLWARPQGPQGLRTCFVRHTKDHDRSLRSLREAAPHQRSWSITTQHHTFRSHTSRSDLFTDLLSFPFHLQFSPKIMITPCTFPFQFIYRSLIWSLRIIYSIHSINLILSTIIDNR